VLYSYLQKRSTLPIYPPYFLCYAALKAALTSSFFFSLCLILALFAKQPRPF
jgi:hypothetical protein